MKFLAMVIGSAPWQIFFFSIMIDCFTQAKWSCNFKYSLEFINLVNVHNIESWPEFEFNLTKIYYFNENLEFNLLILRTKIFWYRIIFGRTEELWIKKKLQQLLMFLVVNLLFINRHLLYWHWNLDDFKHGLANYLSHTKVSFYLVQFITNLQSAFLKHKPCYDTVIVDNLKLSVSIRGRRIWWSCIINNSWRPQTFSNHTYTVYIWPLDGKYPWSHWNLFVISEFA